MKEPGALHPDWAYRVISDYRALVDSRVRDERRALSRRRHQPRPSDCLYAFRIETLFIVHVANRKSLRSSGIPTPDVRLIEDLDIVSEECKLTSNNFEVRVIARCFDCVVCGIWEGELCVIEELDVKASRRGVGFLALHS